MGAGVARCCVGLPSVWQAKYSQHSQGNRNNTVQIDISIAPLLYAGSSQSDAWCNYLSSVLNFGRVFARWVAAYSVEFDTMAGIPDLQQLHRSNDF